ncbi:MAG: NADP-dependent oxidoreductase, partial [Mucilaginibacter sp.]
MKAIQFETYGDSSVLKLTQAEKPQPAEGEILIKIAATTVNPFDMKMRSGSMQKMVPINLPWIPGSDAAGVIEAVGNAVSRLKVGDKVFGGSFGGTYAEYVVVKEENAALIPNNVTLNEAAALEIPLVTSYTFLVEGADLKQGQRVLIHGAAGAVGSVMVQL